MLTLYHGTYELLTGKPRPVSPIYKNADLSVVDTDYGLAFYTTTDKEYAIRSALTQPRLQNYTCVYAYSFDDTSIKHYDFNVPDILWLLYIAKNRHLFDTKQCVRFCDSFNDLMDDCGYICGPSADGAVSWYINNYFNPCADSARWTDSHILKCIELNAPPQQHAFISYKACKILSNGFQRLLQIDFNKYYEEYFNKMAIEQENTISYSNKILLKTGMAKGITFYQTLSILNKYSPNIEEYLNIRNEIIEKEESV